VLGGLARRVAFVEKMRGESAHTLIVDSGDLFFSPTDIDQKDLAQKKARLMVLGYKRMGAAALNVGDMDLLFGVDFLRREAAGLPLVSANLLDAASKAPLFPPFVIREIAGVRIAFFGLLTNEFLPESAPVMQGAHGEKLRIQDPQESARETVQKLSGRADLVILLSDLGLSKDQMLAKSVPGIHFILGGHEGRYLRWPQQVGNTYIFQSAKKGMYMGTLRLTLENLRSPFQDEGQIDQINAQIEGLGYRLRGLEKARTRQPDRKAQIDQSIAQINRQLMALEEKNRQVRASSTKGNRFLYNLVQLGTTFPEDPEVKRWITEAGIVKD
jgi:2',3'-cyclic-nucleotide 2'-phosphodiesterase (5'-nucleotidase family)